MHPSHLLFLHQFQHPLEITDIHPDELVIRLVLDVLEVRKVAGIGELVKIDDLVLGVFVDEESYDMRSDETGSSGDYY